MSVFEGLSTEGGPDVPSVSPGAASAAVRATPAQPNLLRNPRFVETKTEWDIIIVGAGSSGCALAGRLARARPDLEVLLIEAGESDEALPNNRVPARWAKGFHTKHDWGYHSEHVAHLGGRREYYPRAKVTGGCSASNAMMWVWGSPGTCSQSGWANVASDSFPSCCLITSRPPFAEDWERWPEGWRWEEMRGILRGVEENEIHPSQAPKALLQEAVIDSFAALGHKRRANLNDHDDGVGGEGIGYVPRTIDGTTGRRVSAYTAFVEPLLGKQETFKVAVECEVSRLLTEGAGDTLRCVGVEVARGSSPVVLRARHEVVVAGGAINSPKLLLQSGIGPRAELEEAGIACVADVPGVGKNLQDHAIMGMCLYSALPCLASVELLTPSLSLSP